ncbi:MAG: ABC-F family ATP-binding cassette domain-containing protein [Candidatus Zixiibacteriota bacterium]
MILVSLHGVTKGFSTGASHVLAGVDWEILAGEKIALVGRNGSGKTTLLGIVSGRLESDSGLRTLGRGVRISEMGQIPDRDLDATLFDHVRSARADLLELRARLVELTGAVARTPHDEAMQARLGTVQAELDHARAYDLEHQVESVLQGLGFGRERWDDPVGLFSGGERTRMELARQLLLPADLLLLDEPTNHLDIPATEWLEEFLIDSPQACVLVSHDRVFLERFAGRVVELVDGKLEQYDGNYGHYQTEKPRRVARRQKAYELQQAEIARIEDFIARNIAGQKTRQAQSRRHALTKLERLERPRDDTSAIRLGFEAQRRSFREVLIVSGFSRRFDERELLSDVSFVCERGDKVGVIGPNGSGKSTLLRAIVGLDDLYDGEIRLGERVELGYFDQHLETLDGTGRVIDEIWDTYPHFEAGPLRSYLARFLFTGDDVFKSVADLSGGEKNRLALAKLMLTKANFLVLDEPTNHLDVTAREVLEEAIADFAGTALVVSHDRRFLDRFTNKILYVADGTAALSLGRYSDWAAARVARLAEATKPRTEKQADSQAAAEWARRKKERAQVQKIERQRRRLEDELATRESRIVAIETQLADEDVARDWQRLAALTEERTRLYEEMEGLLTELETSPPSDESPA